MRSLMIPRRRFLQGALFTGVYTMLRPLSAAAPTTPLKIMVPAYFYPGGAGLQAWNKLIAAASKVSLVAIANPASGPGNAVDPNYTNVLQQAIAANVKVIGYVSTSYAQRNLTAIQTDIDRWYQFYPQIQGIFLDEQASDANHVAKYVTYRDYIRGKSATAFIVTNPGTPCNEGYLSQNVSDVVCIIERGKSLATYQAPAWTSNYSADRFYGLAYKLNERDMKSSLTAARQKHLGYVYITDDKLPNPWDTLPAYWDAEVNLAGVSVC